MPFVDDAQPAGLAPQLDVPLAVTPPVPPFSRLFQAAFERENPYISTAEALGQRPMAPFDPSFDPFRHIAGYEDYAASFVGANSDDDVLAVKSRIDHERKRDEILSGGGLLGVAASIGAGLADPIMLIPVGGELVAASRTGRALESALRLGVTGGVTTAAQEAVLQGTQLTRPGSESAIAIAGATLLGGVLGGAVGTLSRPVDDALFRSASRGGEVFERELTPSLPEPGYTIRRGYQLETDTPGETRAYAILSPEGRPVGGAHITVSADGRLATFDNITGTADMRQVAQEFFRENPLVQEITGERLAGEVPGVTSITREEALVPTGDGSTAGAMARRGTTLSQETIANTLGVDRALAFSSPTLRLASSDSVETRRIAQELADQPLVTRGNVQGIASPVSVERRIAMAQGPLAESMTGLDDAYVRYRLGRAQRFGDITRIGLRDLVSATDKMGYNEFAEAVGRAMRRGDVSDVPEVAQAAAQLRKQVFDPLKDRAIAAGLLPKDVEVSTAASYLSRMYNTVKIAAQRPKFEQIITDWLAGLKVPELKGLSELELRDIARQITDQLLHAAPGRTNYSPVPLVRGPLRERTLNIPDALIEDFLESDVRRIARSYTRTMAADTSLSEAFGRADMEPAFDRVRENYAQLGQGVTDERAQTRLNNQLKADLRDLAAVRDRVRGTFGLPENPDGLWNRSYHVIRDLNYLRLLGGMTISAFPDLGRTVMTHGLLRVIGDGIVPMLTGFRQFRLAASEVKLAGNALDMVLDTRAMAMADMLDDYGRWSRYERGLKAMTEQFGIVSLMAPWNAALKQFVGVVGQTRTLKVIEAMASGGRVSAADRTRLAHLGIGEEQVERIAAMFKAHGSKGGDRAAEAVVKSPVETFYHGTAGRDFTEFATPEVYMTLDEVQAGHYARGAHLGGAQGGEQRVLPLSAKPGKVRNIDDALFDAMEHGDDLQTVINEEVVAARKAGERYLEYTHPNAGVEGEHTVRVSLFPREDLAIQPAGKPGPKSTPPTSGGGGGGGGGGAWWANTAAWEDTYAADAFRAALSKEVDIAIVTPGQEKPLWMSTGMGKVIGQFRSFSMASTQRVMMTGLQQRDMATLNGILLMTALGAGSTWIRRQTDPHAQPLPDPSNAAGAATWLKEGIDRAGLTGWLFDVNNIVEKVTRGAVGASALTGGPPMSRYASRNVVESLLGPTVGFVGDAASAAGAATGGEWTEADTRAVRRMLPYQNLIGVRHLFDMAEEGLKR